MMTAAELAQWALASLPEIVVVTGACILLILGQFLRKDQEHVFLLWASVAIVLLAALATLMLAGEARAAYTGMFVADRFAVFFKVVLYVATALTFLLSRKYAEIERIGTSEYYVLLLLALSGMMIMVSATDLMSVYVGLELMALCTYVLTGFMRRERRSNEAALKYVILGAVSTGIFLYGVSLVYGLTGTTRLDGMAAAVTGDPLDPGLLLATVFIVAGLVFKVGAVPFHMWVPDVYEGAPTTIAAFMSVGPKAAGFAVILRVFLNPLVAASEVWIIVAAIAVATMALGSFVALVQDNFKRLLAYSSIAHAGFAMFGVVAGGSNGIAGVMLYLLIYAFMNLGIFATVIMMRNGSFSGEVIEDYAGFAKSHGGLALLMLLYLFSLAGIPPTAGFFAKFYVLVALVERGFVTLAVIAVLLSAVAAYFYIRIVMIIYMREPQREFEPVLTPAIRATLAFTAAGTVGIGLFPAWFLDLAQSSVFSFLPADRLSLQ